MNRGGSQVQAGASPLLRTHPNKFALCQPLVRHTHLRVKIQRNTCSHDGRPGVPLNSKIQRSLVSLQSALDVHQA
jgi:hypothetical protein